MKSMRRNGDSGRAFSVAALTAAALSLAGCAAGGGASGAPNRRLFPAPVGDRFGYIDATGSMVVPPRFGYAEPFGPDGLARVFLPQGARHAGTPGGTQPGGAGFIDASGRVAIPLVWDVVEPFSPEGLAVVQRGGKYGYVDRRGNVVIPLQFDRADTFSEGLALVQDARGQRFIDATGATVIAMDAVTWEGRPVSAFSTFSEGLVQVSLQEGGQSRMGFMDRTGRIAIAPRFYWAYGMHEGHANVSVGDLGRAHGLIDRTGAFVIPPVHASVGPVQDGIVSIATAEDWMRGYLDVRNEIVVPPIYAFAGDFSEGLCPVRTDGPGPGRWAYVDRAGRAVLTLPPGIRYADSFHEGLAAVETDQGWRFIRRDGTWAFDARFAKASRFRGGLSRVLLESGEGGYVNASGQIVFRSAPPVHPLF